MWNLIVSVPDHCLSVYFERRGAGEAAAYPWRTQFYCQTNAASDCHNLFTLPLSNRE